MASARIRIPARPGWDSTTTSCWVNPQDLFLRSEVNALASFFPQG